MFMKSRITLMTIVVGVFHLVVEIIVSSYGLQFLKLFVFEVGF